MDLEILKIASNTENHKVLKNYTHFSKLKNSMCGDEMQISLKIVNDSIVDFGYQCKSCVYCQAAVSLLSRNAINIEYFTKIRNNIAKFQAAIKSNNTDQVQKSFSQVNSSLAKAVKRGLIKKQFLSRKLSSLSNQIKKNNFFSFFSLFFLLKILKEC